ncbi:HCO3 transporter family-domain-containing protein [Elsinoe ampelina]|uniref:HCO3 transporter family-domain-containing protein n=1 Tax=Elsinoe ampelina TaxID=302913 RepID=A0A6A6GBX9_9PEZI|nr:HCO3 transporter family-domain-containing protein [Elsinoe ampelina]
MTPNLKPKERHVEGKDPYNWDGLTGWKSYRMLRPFRGMYHDVRRRAPYYWSDIYDGFNYRTFAATIRIYFVNILPAIAFQLDMSRRTDYTFFGINEALFASALAAIVFSLFAAQPLTIVGITGLISLFNYTIYDIAVEQGIGDQYPAFIGWVGIWAAITHWIMAAGNLCDYMRYITDFSSSSFGLYVGIIYMIKGVEELVDEFVSNNARAGFLAVVVALCYWFTVYCLELVPQTIIFTPAIRKLISDYAYPIATLFYTGFVHIPGPLKDTNVLKLPTAPAFMPTVQRSWFVEFYTLPVKWVFVALPIGMLMTLLFYYDHNISSITAQARKYPLKKPAGFHWDFFLLGITCFIGGILGLPLPNGLVPQAPVHTDACTDYADNLHKVREDEDGVVQDRNRKTIDAVAVKEQRVSHFLMGLGLIGTMTGPLLVVLRTMPRCLFCGVFFVVGWGSIEGNDILHRLLWLMKERRFIDPQDPLLKVPRKQIAHYIFWQFFGVFASVAISQTIGAIGFPIIILSLIPLRWKVYPRWFTREELEIMDNLTADADVVLASVGGRPEMPEVKRERLRMGIRSGHGEVGETSGSEQGRDDREKKE